MNNTALPKTQKPLFIGTLSARWDKTKKIK
jgi:hypothetical protein